MDRREFLKTIGVVAAASMVYSPLDLLADTFQKQEATPKNFIWNEEYSFQWTKKFPYSLMTGSHVFPVDKYDQLFHQLNKEQIVTRKNLLSSKRLTPEDLQLVHSPKQLQRLETLANSLSGVFNGENPLTPHILDFAKMSCAGTYQTACSALENGRAMNLSGGFHHAFPDYEEGFCYLNDVAVAIKKLQKEKKVKTAMVVDCDVHHGNGTADIFRQDPSVFTFDLYQSDNYPIEKIKTDVAIALDSRNWINNGRYLKELTSKLKPALESFKPDIVFYLDGADPLETDLLGGFMLTHQGMKERDNYVLNTTQQLGIPTAVVLAGGYSPDVEDVVKVHHNCADVVKKLD